MFDPQWFLQDEDGRGMRGCGSIPEEFMVLKYRADLLYYRGQFQEATRLYAKVCLPLAMKVTEVIFIRAEKKALRPWTVPKLGWHLVNRVVMTTLGLINGQKW